MIDVLLTGMVAWSGILGWKRGARRALVDALSAMVSVFFVTSSLPSLEPAFLPTALAQTLERFIAEHTRSQAPTVLKVLSWPNSVAVFGSEHGPAGGAPGLIHRQIYHGLSTVLAAIALFLAFQLSLNVYARIREIKVKPAHERRPILGTAIGLLLGCYMALFALNVLVLLCWFNNSVDLDHWVGTSVAARGLGILLKYVVA